MTNENTPRQLSKEEKQEIKSRYLTHFTRVRHDYLDDLPSERLTASDKDYEKYKCRATVILDIRNRIDTLHNHGMVKGQKALEKSEVFMNQVQERDFSIFSTQEDIDKLNDILDIMIEELS